MDWQLDHVFLAVRDLAAAEQRISELGMTFSERGAHRGQGTINACAMFRNVFFELLGPRDRAELRSDVVKPLGLDERIEWRESAACPFGVCFRPSQGALDVVTLPFQTWAYSPPYLPAGDSIPIVTPRDRLREPVVFLQKARARFWPGDAQHRGSPRELTKICMTLPPLAEPISDGVRWFSEHQSLELKSGASYLLELQWDGGREQQSARLEDLPLLVSW